MVNHNIGVKLRLFEIKYKDQPLFDWLKAFEIKCAQNLNIPVDSQFIPISNDKLKEEPISTNKISARL
jgi:hypothetical protein